MGFSPHIDKETVCLLNVKLQVHLYKNIRIFFKLFYKNIVAGIIFENIYSMIINYTEEQYLNSKSTDLLELICEKCSNIFKIQKKLIKNNLKYPERQRLKYCSRICLSDVQNKSQIINCTNCNKKVLKMLNEIKAVKNNFCSQSCAATYNNTHKTKGNRRSKLEFWLENKLNILYPNLNILYCDKTTINSELDIYIPSLKLAFELNGIYHYEPIHGQDKLNQVKNNDNRKFQACLENNIELVIIDSSSLKYFKEQNCIKYLDIISNIINLKLNS